MKKILLILTITLICTSCAAADPLTRAQSFTSKGKYEEAIKLLESEMEKRPKSIPVKSLLAQIYSDYGLSICQDSELEPREKYPLAKKKFAKALELNPYLTEAKEMHETIEKIQAAFKQSEKVDSAEDLNKIDDEIAKAKAEEKLEETAAIKEESKETTN